MHAEVYSCTSKDQQHCIHCRSCWDPVLLHHAESLAEHERKKSGKDSMQGFCASSLVKAQDEQQHRCTKHMVHAALLQRCWCWPLGSIAVDSI